MKLNNFLATIHLPFLPISILNLTYIPGMRSGTVPDGRNGGHQDGGTVVQGGCGLRVRGARTYILQQRQY